jgi:hypothetical protein
LGAFFLKGVLLANPSTPSNQNHQSFDFQLLSIYLSLSCKSWIIRMKKMSYHRVRCNGPVGVRPGHEDGAGHVGHGQDLGHHRGPEAERRWTADDATSIGTLIKRFVVFCCFCLFDCFQYFVRWWYTISLCSELSLHWIYLLHLVWSINWLTLKSDSRDVLHK